MNATNILLQAARSFGYWTALKQRYLKSASDGLRSCAAMPDGAAYANLQIIQSNMPRSQTLRRRIGEEICRSLRGTLDSLKPLSG